MELSPSEQKNMMIAFFSVIMVIFILAVGINASKQNLWIKKRKVIQKDKPFSWDSLRQSRLGMFLIIYASVQLLTLVIGLIVHFLLPSSLWCKTVETGLLGVYGNMNCGFLQLNFILYVTFLISIFAGFFAFCFPNKVANVLKESEE